MSKTIKQIIGKSRPFRKINRKAKSNKFWRAPIDRTEITLLVDPVRPKRTRRKASVKLK